MFASLLQAHLKRYPAMQVQDIYKLVHQAALGSEHALLDASAARNFLENEIKEMGSGLPEPLTDPISADAEILRIHLRPYLASGGTPETLLDAFLATAHNFHGDITTLESYWDTARRTRFLPDSVMDGFILKMREAHYPAVHHSEIYRENYQPAYRVIWRRYWE